MDDGEWLTRWSVRVAVVCYVLALTLRLRGRLAAARAMWGVGLVAFVLHVGFAFHVFHAWSHREAYDFTAKQTEELVGWHWGGGVWLNYLFAAAWLGDWLWWMRGLERYEARPRWVEAAVQGFLGFIAFNAVVVFPTGTVRWAGIAATAWLVGLYIAGRLRPVSDPHNGKEPGSHGA